MLLKPFLSLKYIPIFFNSSTVDGTKNQKISARIFEVIKFKYNFIKAFPPLQG
jgi:hypothetical protein